MSRRTPVNRSADKKHFRRAYVKTKKVNRKQAVGQTGIMF